MPTLTSSNYYLGFGIARSIHFSC